MNSMRPFALLVGLICCLLPNAAAGQPASAPQLLTAAQRLAQQRQHEKSVELATAALRLDPALADAYYLRGRERFCLGEFPGSADDFDHFIALRPDQRRRLWEHGIACYYAGRYREGADQFVAYQDFDDSDVENAVWHLVCLSRVSGLAAAQQQLMKVKRDERVPMMAIYDLFGGQNTTPQDVLQRVEVADLSTDNERAAYFYAHLYIGLFYEASGDERRAREHITIAAEKYPIRHYMGDVARVHAARWKSPVVTTP